MTSSSCRCTRHAEQRPGLRRTFYTPDEIDAFAAYAPLTERCYFLDVAEFAGRQAANLRIGATRNNQSKRIRWASDYEFGATLAMLPGPIAQLGERDAGSVEVAGSSPAGSIESSRKPPDGGCAFQR